MPLGPSDYHADIFTSPILIVDDQKFNCLFIEQALRARGFSQLQSVNSGEAALQAMERFHPDIVILDIMMPGMDGYALCEALRQHQQWRDLPILVQTVITEPENRVKAFEKGATDFVSKPVYADELCARVMVHLEKRHSLKALQSYQRRVAYELENARQLQLAILPSAHELAEIGSHRQLDLAAYFQPSSEIGGDFWGIKTLFPHQTALWLVDFAGHGVAAALHAFQLQAYLKENSALAARPGEYLSFLNDKMLHLLRQGEFATMFYGIIDGQSNQLFYACACAPHPILWRKATGKAEMIRGNGTPLGIGMHLYPTQTVPFAVGDMLILYSDALTETPNAEGRYISEQEIMALISNHPPSSAEALKERLLTHFKQHIAQTITDDLTITICGRSAA